MLGERMRVNCPDEELWLTDPNEPHPVILKSRLGMAIEATRDLVLKGRGYETPEHAQQQAFRWRSAVTIGLAAHNVGADFGERVPASWMDPGFIHQYADPDHPVLHDQHALMIFPTEPAPRFLGLAAGDVIVGKAQADVRDAIQLALDKATQLSDRQHLAYAVYNSSFGMLPDARLVALVSAIELMTNPKERDMEAQAVVDSMAKTITSSDMDQPTKDSMKGALTWLRRQSIKQSVKDVALTLGDRKYMGESAVKFVLRCYDLRSSLVHGPTLPDWNEVNLRGAELERMVGDLIAISIVDDTGIRPMATWVGQHASTDWDGDPRSIPMDGDSVSWPDAVEGE